MQQIKSNNRQCYWCFIFKTLNLLIVTSFLSNMSFCHHSEIILLHWDALTFMCHKKTRYTKDTVAKIFLCYFFGVTWDETNQEDFLWIPWLVPWDSSCPWEETQRDLGKFESFLKTIIPQFIFSNSSNKLLYNF